MGIGVRNAANEQAATSAFSHAQRAGVQLALAEFQGIANINPAILAADDW